MTVTLLLSMLRVVLTNLFSGIVVKDEQMMNKVGAHVCSLRQPHVGELLPLDFIYVVGIGN